MRVIPGLLPSTKYVVNAWTEVVGRTGKLLATSPRVNLTVYTGKHRNAKHFMGLSNNVFE